MVDSLILGLGKSGIAAAAHLLAKGESVIVSDQRSLEAFGSSSQLQVLKSLEERHPGKISWALGGHPLELLEQCERIVVSPGISLHNEFLVQARMRGLPLVGEIELAWLVSSKPMLAVTGTNGKSTTCTVLGDILGDKAVVGGNIGTPLLGLVDNLEEGVEWVVAEISSFQLETVHDFRPKIAILTNITPDHLDHHKDLEEYYAAKSRMFAKMTAADLAIFSADDAGAQRMSADLQAGKLPSWLDGFPSPGHQDPPRQLHYSVKGPVLNGAALVPEDGKLWVMLYRQGIGSKLFAWDFPGLPGEAMQANGLASVLAALELGVGASEIELGLRRFQPLHYRMQLSGELNGVKFVNDSKATNIASALSSVRTAGSPLSVIVGGKDKGVDYQELARGLTDSGARIYLIGEAAGPIGDSLKRLGNNNIEHSQRLELAMLGAYQHLKASGGTVLLAPACSSFDQFNSAEHRGHEFDRLVAELMNDKANPQRTEIEV